MLNCMATYRSPGQKAGAVTVLDTCKMASKLSNAGKVVETSAISEFFTPAIAGLETFSCGATALEAFMEGDRPYRVNSGNISLRQS